MTDMEKSELMIATILNLLMDWGIQECQLKFQELELDKEFAPFFFPCVDWLISEGIIRTGKIHRFTDGQANGVVVRPVITAVGMSVLGKSISLGGSEELLGNVVKNVSESGANYTGIGDFFGGMLGGFTKSLGS